HAVVFQEGRSGQIDWEADLGRFGGTCYRPRADGRRVRFGAKLSRVESQWTVGSRESRNRTGHRRRTQSRGDPAGPRPPMREGNRGCDEGTEQKSASASPPANVSELSFTNDCDSLNHSLLYHRA